MKKIAIVTGANKGLGFETASELAKNGFKVVIGSRNEECGKTAVEKLKGAGADAEFMQLDLSDRNSIKKAVETVKNNYDHIDVLVNNAGMITKQEDWQGNSAATIPVSALKETFETNFFGLIDFTQQVLPLLKKSKQANIVNVSSILGSLQLGNDPGSMIYASKPFGYNASKAALNSFTIHLAAALKDQHINVNSAHPGWVRTELGTEYAPLSVEEGAKTIVDLAINAANDTAKFVHLGEEIAW